MKKMKKGFTIVELVIVIGVIAILSAILIPTFVNLSKKAEKSRAAAEVQGAYTAYILDAADGYVGDYEEMTDEQKAAATELPEHGQSEVYIVRDSKKYEYTADGWAEATLNAGTRLGGTAVYNGCEVWLKA